jgi:sarcosine oxidase/sarcosine oxidase/L-pipecolate oxidase
MSLPDRKARILIVGGGGVIGSSTALELARRGYEDIRLLDMFENPSANSAGNDKNKVRVSHLDGPRGFSQRPC